MDTGSTIIGLGLVALIILPFVLHYLFKKRKDLKFLKDFISTAERQNVIIAQKELWKNCYAIGIDTNSKKLFYINKLKNNEQEILIDLSTVEKCRIVNENRSVKTNTGNVNVTDRLELVFTFNNSDLPQKALEFYDSTKFMTPDGELILIENWLGIINSNLKTSKQ